MGKVSKRGRVVKLGSESLNVVLYPTRQKERNGDGGGRTTLEDQPPVHHSRFPNEPVTGGINPNDYRHIVCRVTTEKEWTPSSRGVSRKDGPNGVNWVRNDRRHEWGVGFPFESVRRSDQLYVHPGSRKSGERKGSVRRP